MKDSEDYTVYVVITYSGLDNNRYGLQSCTWSDEQGKLIIPCPRSRLRIWSRKAGSAMPSRVSPPILNTQAESSIINHQSDAYSRVLPISVTASIDTINRYHVYPQFIRSRVWVPMAFISGNLPAQGHSSQGSSSNGCCLFRKYHMSPFPYTSFFPHPFL